MSPENVLIVRKTPDDVPGVRKSPDNTRRVIDKREQRMGTHFVKHCTAKPLGAKRVRFLSANMANQRLGRKERSRYRQPHNLVRYRLEPAMSDDFSFTIEIPCDDEGFVLLQCPQCGEFFKLRPSDYESDEVLEVSCPACGISSDTYLTEEAVNLALAIAKNKTLGALHDEMKRLERRTKGKAVSFKAGKPPQANDEPELQPSVDALTTATCCSCGKQSKISSLLSMSMFTCPLCGVTNFNER